MIYFLLYLFLKVVVIFWLIMAFGFLLGAVCTLGPTDSGKEAVEETGPELKPGNSFVIVNGKLVK